MKESPFGFSYSWRDLEPIRGLALVVCSLQIVGAALGLFRPRFPNWFESIWFGAVVTTFPAFLVGLVVQARLTPGRLGEHKTMVRRLGLIAAFLTVFAFAMPLFGLGQQAA